MLSQDVGWTKELFWVGRLFSMSGFFPKTEIFGNFPPLCGLSLSPCTSLRNLPPHRPSFFLPRYGFLLHLPRFPSCSSPRLFCLRVLTVTKATPSTPMTFCSPVLSRGWMNKSREMSCSRPVMAVAHCGHRPQLVLRRVISCRVWSAHKSKT